MALRLTHEEALALGKALVGRRRLDPYTAASRLQPEGARSTTRAKPTPYHSLCTACGQQFVTQAAEDRHVAPGHARFESIL